MLWEQEVVGSIPTYPTILRILGLVEDYEGHLQCLAWGALPHRSTKLNFGSVIVRRHTDGAAAVESAVKRDALSRPNKMTLKH